jgi:hypothetical protein
MQHCGGAHLPLSSSIDLDCHAAASLTATDGHRGLLHIITNILLARRRR